MKVGYFRSCEEYTPGQLLAQAAAAEEAGFHGLWISDHHHPGPTSRARARSSDGGPDLHRHLDQLRALADAGVDEAYVQQIGGGHEAFFAAYREHVLPECGQELGGS